MTNGLMRLADLRQLLLDMERDLGLADLPEQETRLLYAVAIQTRAKPEVSLVELQEHPLMADISRSTFFRALKHLIKRDYLEKTGAEKRAGYKLINAPLSLLPLQ
jgi:RIO-like serine/threonine protein kinase